MVESEAKMLVRGRHAGAPSCSVTSRCRSRLIRNQRAGLRSWQARLGLGGAGRRRRSRMRRLPRQRNPALADAYRISDKQLIARRQSARPRIGSWPSRWPVAKTRSWSAEEVYGALSKLEKQLVRGRVIAGEPRIDGRDTKTVRPIDVKVGVLPRAHGSAMFTRGETQAIVAATLGTGRDAQIIDAIEGERKEPFMLHYNFPPYCVGETGLYRFAEAPRDRPRQAGQARHAGRDAGYGRFPVRHSRRLGDHRIERFQLDGVGLRIEPCADGRRCTDQGAGCRRRDGPGQRRRELCRPDRHSR